MSDSNSYIDLDIPSYEQHRERQIDHFLLDVREPEEFRMGRIPGAVNIPLAEIEARLDEIPADRPVVVVCAHGIRSIAASELLAAKGHGGVYNLAGGTFAWMMRGLKLEH